MVRIRNFWLMRFISFSDSVVATMRSTKTLLALVLLFAVLSFSRALPPASATGAAGFGTVEGYLVGSIFHSASEVPSGDDAADIAALYGTSLTCTSCETMTFNIYNGGVCGGTAIDTLVVSVPSGPTNVVSPGVSLPAGSYSWKDTWNLPAAPVFSDCEDFVVQGTTSVPQFPLGLIGIFALAVPAILLIRVKFSKPRLPTAA